MALLGVTDVALIDDVVDALAAGDRAAVFETVDRLVEAGHDPRRFAADLLQRLRDLTLLQAVPDARARAVDAAADEVERMVEQAARLGPGDAGALRRDPARGPDRDARGDGAAAAAGAALRADAAAAGDDVGAALLERLERMERRAAIAPDPCRTARPPRRLRPVLMRRSRTRRADVRRAPPPSDQTGSRRRTRLRLPPPPDRAATVPAAPPPGRRARAWNRPTRRGRRPMRRGRGRRRRRAHRGRMPPGIPPAASDLPRVGAEPRRAPRPPRPLTRARPGPLGSAPPAEPDRRAAPARPGPAPSAPDGATRSRPPSRPSVRALDAAAVRRVWSEILAAAKQRSRSTGALMVNATVRTVEGDVLVLAIGSEPLARRLSEQRNTDVIADALHAVLGVRWRVRCDHGDATPPRPAPPRHAPRRHPATGASGSRPAPLRPPGPRPTRSRCPRAAGRGRAAGRRGAMIAEAAADADGPAVRRDPEEVAMELLSAQLGATAIDRR